MKYRKLTKSEIERYLREYTGHPSNIKNFEKDCKLKDGHKNAARYDGERKGKISVVYPWLLADIFSI